MTRLYLKPTAFVPGPVEGADRLAGGMLYFTAYELIVADAAGHVGRRFVPVERIDAEIAALPDPLAAAAAVIRARITAPRAPIRLGAHDHAFDRPSIMAILNVTPDSFSDGGRNFGDPVAAAAAGIALAEQGAAIVDVGGESTRPGGAAHVTASEEIARTMPVIERLAAAGVPVSIDTRKAAVMEAALAAGAAVVNDISALLFDDRAAGLVADAGCPVVLMHFAGTPLDPHGIAPYRDVLLDVYDWLEARIVAAEAAGIARSRIIVDPGIGFGKETLADNLPVVAGLALFHGLGCPLLFGASRKRLVGWLSHDAPAERRLGGSVALALKGATEGAQLLRVHDVFETAQALDVWTGIG